METINLSYRLKLLTDFVHQNDVVADIGTDHAFIPIYLVQTNRTHQVYALDVATGPLGIAAENIQQANLSDFITLLASDGLKNLPTGQVINSCIIAGLGGGTISQILTDDNNLVQRYILCPTNDEHMIRAWIQQQGFFLETELMIQDNQRYYQILVVNKQTGIKVADQMDVLYGPLLRRERSTVFEKYWRSQLKHLRQICQKMPVDAHRRPLVEEQIMALTRMLEEK